MNEMNWYLVFTRPNFERKVSQILSQRGFETYCPLQRVEDRGHHREKVSPKPLFRSWVFVRCASTQLDSLTKCNGVINLVYWLNKPAVVPQEQINTIKFALSRFKQIHLVKTSLNGGANALSMHTKDIVFQLPSLGYSLVVPEETVRVPELIDATDASVSIIRRQHLRSRFSTLLKQLPALLPTRKTAI